MSRLMELHRALGQYTIEAHNSHVGLNSLYHLYDLQKGQRILVQCKIQCNQASAPTNLHDYNKSTNKSNPMHISKYTFNRLQ